MKVLLDTHAFLWWIMNDRRLSSMARAVLQDSTNTILLSAVSGWEIAIKVRLGKLVLPHEPRRFVTEHVAQNNLEVLPISLTHALHVSILPDHHRDPFDRMLVAQSQLERLPILSDDPLITRYSVTCLW